MTYAQIRTGAGLKLKVKYENDTDAPEQTIGFCSNLNFTVDMGQKEIFTVDSPFPQEIAQGAKQSMVRGTVTLYMRKRKDPVRDALVVGTSYDTADPQMPFSRYINWRFYDRVTQELAFAINYVKVGQFSVNVQAKQVVVYTLIFTGMIYEAGSM